MDRKNTEFLQEAKHLIMKLQKTSPLSANLMELQTTILSLKDKGKQQIIFFYFQMISKYRSGHSLQTK